MSLVSFFGVCFGFFFDYKWETKMNVYWEDKGLKNESSTPGHVTCRFWNPKEYSFGFLSWFYWSKNGNEKDVKKGEKRGFVLFLLWIFFWGILIVYCFKESFNVWFVNFVTILSRIMKPATITNHIVVSLFRWIVLPLHRLHDRLLAHNHGNIASQRSHNFPEA